MSFDSRIFFAEGAVEQTEAFSVIGRKRGTYGKLFPSKNVPEVHFTSFSEDHSHYRDAVLAVAHFFGEAPSPQENDTDTPATSSDYYVYLERKASFDIGTLIVDKPSDLTILKSKSTEL